MSVLAHAFNFGRRCVLLHLSVVSGLIAAITLCLGFSVFSRRVREKRIPKLLLSCLPAASFAALLLLYLANYISNARWGNNFNYQVLAQWQFRAEILNGGEHILSTGVYVSLALGLVVIFGVYFALSKTFFQGLEELFLPHRRYSLFRDRTRSLFSLTLISFIAAAFTFYLFILARNVKEVGHLMDEPIIGFFRTETESAETLNKQGLAPKLREQEENFRAVYPRNQQFSRKNVIIIIVDSLRADHMQVYGYERPTTPFLSSLYATGRLRRVNFALATCPYTTCGVLSAMASKNWRSFIPESFKLYDLLFDQGYQVNFILSGNHDWYNLKDSYGRSLSYFFDGSHSSRYTANDDRVILEGLQPIPAYAGKPAFFYFHLMSTHYIGFKQDRYRIYNPSIVEGTWESLISDRYDAVTKTNNYDNGVIQADATIQEIFQSLKQKGYLDDSLVVILSDHGEGLGERGPDYYSHTLTLYQEFLRIPLLIYDAAEPKYGNLEFATQTDVAPTVVNRLGLSIPPSWQGRSLLDPNIKQFSYHETIRIKVPIYAVFDRTEGAIYKYIHAGDKEDELYELVSDPHERQNLMARADAGLIARLKTKLAEYLSHY
jgi:glucan phosphoethanolaminetransferase (alkaline phosphatase superfamily)